MSRIDIANYLGLALETASRGFGRLQDEGLIEVIGRQVTLVDAPALAALAHGRQEIAAAGRQLAG